MINNAYFAFLSDPPEQRTAEFVRESVETGCDSSIRGLGDHRRNASCQSCSVRHDCRAIADFPGAAANGQPLWIDGSQAPELLLGQLPKASTFISSPLPPGNHIIKWTATWDLRSADLSANITYKVKVLTGVSGQQQ